MWNKDNLGKLGRRVRQSLLQELGNIPSVNQAFAHLHNRVVHRRKLKRLFQRATRTALGRAHTSTKMNTLRFASQRLARSTSGPDPKFYQLVLVTYPTQSPSFVICAQLFEI